MEKTENYLKYAMIIQGKIAELFDEENESAYKIDVKDFEDDKKATDFFHALSNIVPCNLYNKLTGDDCDVLAYNHNANRMIFQYSKSADDK